MSGKDVGTYNSGVGYRYGKDTREVIKNREKILNKLQLPRNLITFEEIYDYIINNKLQNKERKIKFPEPKKIEGVIFFEGDKIKISRKKNDLNLMTLIKNFDSKNVEITIKLKPNKKWGVEK